MANLPKPKFFKAELVEIGGNVLDHVYPHLKGKEQLTMSERMGTDEAKCPECSNNECIKAITVSVLLLKFAMVEQGLQSQLRELS